MSALLLRRRARLERLMSGFLSSKSRASLNVPGSQVSWRQILRSIPEIVSPMTRSGEPARRGAAPTLINNALVEHVHRRSMLDAVREVVREELAPYGIARAASSTRRPRRSAH